MSEETQRPLILVADDDWLNRDMLRDFLTQEGYGVIRASNGVETLAALSDHPIDLVLLDIKMPDINGYEICRKVRATPEIQHLPIIMLTGMDSDDDLQEALKAGTDDFITKPFNSTLLLAHVRTLVRLKLLQDKVSAYEDGFREIVQKHAAPSAADAILEELDRMEEQL